MCTKITKDAGNGDDVLPRDDASIVVVVISKTQIDRLGERLKIGEVTSSDLVLLDEYRRSFQGAYEAVVGTLRRRLQLEPTGREAKTTGAIVDKLRRESVRLSQIQDIAGCRVIVADLAGQDAAVAAIGRLFDRTTVIDRRP